MCHFTYTLNDVTHSHSYQIIQYFHQRRSVFFEVPIMEVMRIFYGIFLLCSMTNMGASFSLRPPRRIESKIHRQKRAKTRVRRYLAKTMVRFGRLVKHAAQTIDEINREMRKPICLHVHSADLNKDVDGSIIVSFFNQLNRLKDLSSFLLFDSSYKASNKLKVMLIRDLALGNRLRESLLHFYAPSSSASSRKIYRVRTTRIVEVSCKTQRPVTLRKVFLSTYGRLKRTSRKILRQRFPTNGFGRFWGEGLINRNIYIS